MKASHTTTPRTLAETSFVTGYHSHQPRAGRGVAAHIAGWIVIAGCSVLIGVFLGMGIVAP